MDLAYAAADIVISRAGASSVSELCVGWKTRNFHSVAECVRRPSNQKCLGSFRKKGSNTISEKDLESNFETQFSTLIASESQQIELSTNIKKLALKQATQTIADEIEKLLNK